MDKACVAANRETLGRVADQIFFIVGSGRSGTSLLQGMIAAHPSAVMPNETKFLTVLRKQFADRDRIGDAEVFERAVDYTLSRWWIADMKLDEGRVRELCASGDRSWETILLSILAAHAEAHGADRVGEKSPGHMRHIGYLSEKFPRSRFVHVMRDPRAVVLSKLRTDFGSKSVWHHIETWKEAARQHATHSQRLGSERYHLVRYERLVSDAEGTIRGLCDFLGLPFDESMLHHERRKVRGFAERQAGHMSNTLRPLFTSSIEKWRQEMPGWQVALIEHAAGEQMRDLGYELTGAMVSVPGLRLAASRVGFLVSKAVERVRGRRGPGQVD